jgi:hypothetical protein
MTPMIKLVERPNTGINYTSAFGDLELTLSSLSKKSPTAKDLIDFVQASPLTVEILCANEPGAFGPFNDEWSLTGPCIIWSPTKKFKCKAGTIKGYRASGAPILEGKKVDTFYGPEITLLHELGHFRQYIEDATRFASRGPTGEIVEGKMAVKDIEADNLRRHENPVCKELGLPQRLQYSDFDGFFDV